MRPVPPAQRKQPRLPTIASMATAVQLRDPRFAERRAELSEAALQTLSTLGFARTSLREIAQNSDFSHGVLHYYFADKLDLILCSVRQYKARCVTRYDAVVEAAKTFDELLEGFIEALGDTLRTEASLHRLWYDLRAQAMFEPAYRDDVAAIDKSLEQMIWRVVQRLCELGRCDAAASPGLAYASLDGVFQQALLRHLSGDRKAITVMKKDAETLLRHLLPLQQPTAP